MVTYVAVFRGDSLTDARMVCASAAPQVVQIVANLLLKAPRTPLMRCLQIWSWGKRRALRLIKREAQHALQA